LNQLFVKSRDNTRTPMQWTSGPNAGFCPDSEVQPWISINGDHDQVNAEQQVQDPHSVYSFYRHLIQLRKENPIFVYGDYHILLYDHPHVDAYIRQLDNTQLLILANFSAEEVVVEFSMEDLQKFINFSDKKLLSGVYHDRDFDRDDSTDFLHPFILDAYDARIYKLTG